MTFFDIIYLMVWQTFLLNICLFLFLIQTRKCMVLLLSSVSPSELSTPMDNTDGGLKCHLSEATELWSDMIIFASVTPSKIQSSSVNCTLNLPMIGVI